TRRGLDARAFQQTGIPGLAYARCIQRGRPHTGHTGGCLVFKASGKPGVLQAWKTGPNAVQETGHIADQVLGQLHSECSARKRVQDTGSCNSLLGSKGIMTLISLVRITPSLSCWPHVAQLFSDYEKLALLFLDFEGWPCVAWMAGIYSLCFSYLGH